MVGLCIFLGVGWRWDKIEQRFYVVSESSGVTQQRCGNDKSRNNPVSLMVANEMIPNAR